MSLSRTVKTVIITAGATSIAWMVFGGAWFDMLESNATEAGDDLSAEAPGGIEDARASSDEMEDITAPIPQPPVRSAASSSQVGIIIPVEGIEADQLTDSFFQPRGGNGERLHEAIDIMATTGTAVVVAAEGTIAKLHNSGPGGNSIYIRSPDRKTIYYYAHLDQYAPGLEEGQRVRAGQRLGTVGSSGNADPAAPHLHFQILETSADANWWEPANAVNPYPVLTEAARANVP
ncbi:MAG: M23 family metallopeptidase [Erythrobacter sp.]